MSIVLSNKAEKLMKLCTVEGLKSLDDLLVLAGPGQCCPAICMTEGCDHTAKMEPDQEQGHFETCGGATMTSALVLAGLI